MLQASDGPGAEDDGRSRVRKTWDSSAKQKDFLDLTVPRSVYLTSMNLSLSYFHGLSGSLLCARQDINIGDSRASQHAQCLPS